MEFDKHRPIYAQVMDHLKEQMVNGTYQPGESLPSRREIARELGINPNTVQRAFAQLEEQGYLTTQNTQSSVVTTDQEKLQQLRHEQIQQALDALITTADHIGLSLNDIQALLIATYQRRNHDD
ncbi:MAG: GntR family transcriptional regulator [Aerococcus sp.]|nr:GntR family transcriptional regulator [Aerococcus sp.]